MVNSINIGCSTHRGAFWVAAVFFTVRVLELNTWTAELGRVLLLLERHIGYGWVSLPILSRLDLDLDCVHFETLD